MLTLSYQLFSANRHVLNPRILDLDLGQNRMHRQNGCTCIHLKLVLRNPSYYSMEVTKSPTGRIVHIVQRVIMLARRMPNQEVVRQCVVRRCLIGADRTRRVDCVRPDHTVPRIPRSLPACGWLAVAVSTFAIKHDAAHHLHFAVICIR